MSMTTAVETDRVVLEEFRHVVQRARTPRIFAASRAPLPSPRWLARPYRRLPIEPPSLDLFPTTRAARVLLRQRFRPPAGATRESRRLLARLANQAACW